MTHEQKVMNTAILLHRRAQTHCSSPYYSESENFVDRVLERAMKAGCPIAERIDLTHGQDRRVCKISFDEAKIVAEYFESYVEPLFTVTFRFNNGTIKVIKHRDQKQVDELRRKGALIEAIKEN